MHPIAFCGEEPIFGSSCALEQEEGLDRHSSVTGSSSLTVDDPSL